MRRILALLILPLVAIILAASGLQDSLVWPQLAGRVQALQAFASAHPVLAATLYIVAYAVIAACCLPLGPLMGVAGGALFGPWVGTPCAVTGATGGAVLLFLFARGALGGALTGRHGALLPRVQLRLQRDGFPALLAARVAPVMPSWLLTLGAALAGMQLRPFIAATALGLVPGTAVFASTGAELDAVLARGTLPSLGSIMHPSMLLPLLALSGLAFLPVILRRVRLIGQN